MIKMAKTLKLAPTLRRFSKPEEIRGIIDRNEIATLSLRLPTPCNLDCLDCYGTPKTYKELKQKGDHLTYSELLDVIDQASELGLKSVSIVGDGEPTLYRAEHNGETRTIEDLIAYINSKGAHVMMFTNAIPINEEMAYRLFELDLAIIGKQNSLNPEVQNKLVGHKRGYGLLMMALEYLKEAGFNKVNPTRLAIHTIIDRPNFDEIPELWRQWRKENIIPYAQVTVPPRSGTPEYEKFVRYHFVELGRVADLVSRLRTIDKEEFGYYWEPGKEYPIIGLGCSVVLTGFGIAPNGNVQLCAYTEDPKGNVRKQRLKDILNSQEVQRIRHHNYGGEDGFNYGCRALTFNETGDRFAKDPMQRKIEVKK